MRPSRGPRPAAGQNHRPLRQSASALGAEPRTPPRGDVTSGWAGRRGRTFQGPSGGAGGFLFQCSEAPRKAEKVGGKEAGRERVARGGRPSDPPPTPSNGRAGAGQGRDLKVGSPPPYPWSLQGSTRGAARLPPLPPPSVALSRVFPSPLHSSRAREPGGFTFRALNVLAFLLLTHRDLLEHFLWVPWDPTKYILSHLELEALGFE